MGFGIWWLGFDPVSLLALAPLERQEAVTGQAFPALRFAVGPLHDHRVDARPMNRGRNGARGSARGQDRCRRSLTRRHSVGPPGALDADPRAARRRSGSVPEAGLVANLQPVTWRRRGGCAAPVRHVQLIDRQPARGRSLFVTTISTSPSLSRSPNAAPRLTSDKTLTRVRRDRF